MDRERSPLQRSPHGLPHSQVAPRRAGGSSGQSGSLGLPIHPGGLARIANALDWCGQSARRNGRASAAPNGRRNMRNIMGQCHALRCIAAAGLVTLALWLGATGLAASAPQLRSFPIPTRDSQPIGIALGPDGNLWFTESRGQKVARITPSGVITEFALPGTFPGDIIAGPDEAIWFTDSTGQKVWRLNLATQGLTSFPLPSASFPGDITTGADGNLWFTDAGTSTVDRLTPAGGLTEFGGGQLDIPYAITTGPDGNVWFTERFAQRIDRITPEGVITAFTTPGHT